MVVLSNGRDCRSFKLERTQQDIISLRTKLALEIWSKILNLTTNADRISQVWRGRSVFIFLSPPALKLELLVENFDTAENLLFTGRLPSSLN